MSGSFYCRMCPLSLRSRSTLKRHINRHHPRRPLHHQTFVDASGPAAHRYHPPYGSYSSHNGRQRPAQGYMYQPRQRAAYICGDCWREYPDLSALNMHCCECDCIFRSKASLENHQVSHLNHPLPSPPPTHRQQFFRYHCSLCRAQYRRKSLLTAHFSRHIYMLPCLAEGDCASFFEHPEDMIKHFDHCHCGSRLSLTRAYARVHPNVSRGGLTTRARAERWVERYFEKHAKLS
ncbi:hypothetical protein F5Y06DRAFT_299230 [Hypoxylon sp. FL0890]|nr:hypothetical protein F5Y06DRAFT_299230 [Hypoxylon sp. FL0890]